MPHSNGEFRSIWRCLALWILLAYGIPFSGSQRLEGTNAASDKIVPGTFVDIAQKVGIQFRTESSPTAKKYLLEAMGSGVALFDYDNDGRVDIFFANGARINDPTPKGTIPQKDNPAYWNRLYHQKSDGTFEDVTVKAGLTGVGYSTGVAVGDYDNDGHEDLFVAGYGRNTLYHNSGNGTFSDVTLRSGTTGSGWAASAGWVDYNKDGNLDLVVVRYLSWDFDDIACPDRQHKTRAYCHPDMFNPISLLLFHNNGDGTFSEVSRRAGVDKPINGLGVAFADYDHDGWPDILTANDSVAETLFRNKGDGTFQEVGLNTGLGLDGNGATFAGMGVDFEDYNNDGWPDVIITDLARQKYALYTNAKNGTFDYSTNTSGLGAITLLHSGWGVKFLDYDNDGWKDLFITQSHVMDTVEITEPNLAYKESPLLVRNQSGTRFVDVSAQSGEVFGRRMAGRGLAAEDLDNDGRIDVVVTTNGGPAMVLRNETTTTNHWITLKLVGVKSNRDGIGAQVEISSGGREQFATVTTAGSYESSSDPRAHFGLGEAANVKRILVRWPSGLAQTIENVKADQFLRVVEPTPR